MCECLSLLLCLAFKLRDMPNRCVTKCASFFFLLHSSKLLSCRNIKKQDRRTDNSERKKEGELTWSENNNLNSQRDLCSQMFFSCTGIRLKVVGERIGGRIGRVGL